MATDHNFRVKNGLEIGGVVTVSSSGNFSGVGTISSGAITSSASITASGNSNNFGNTTIAALSATSGTFSASITASGNSNSFGNSSFGTISSGAITSTGLLTAVGGMINTNTGSNPFRVSRLGATSEALAISVADREALFMFKQDESTGVHQYTFDFDTPVADSSSYFRFMSGRVGITEGAPESRLHITGTDGGWNKHITIEHDSNDIGKILVDTDGMKFRNMSSGNGFYFRDSDNNTDMFIASDGDVGIGTTSPSERLTVNGNIYAISGTINASAYKLNGTFVMDSSRNLVNIGTISSGAITSSGQLTLSSTTNDASSYAMRVSSSSGAEKFYIRGDGVVVVSGSQYFYVTASGGAYFNNSLRARGGITNDQGDLALNDVVNITGDLKKGGTIVMDSSRNLTNIGTVSSGAITSSGIIEAAGALRVTETGTAQAILIGNQDSAGVNKPAIVQGVNGAIRIGHGSSWSGEGGTFTEKIAISSNDLKITSGGLLIGTTAVIDASRNLTNIGTISSGAITATTLRLTATGDASAGSTGHGFQVGDTSSSNIIIDNNEIMSRNNGSVATLHLNADGGNVAFRGNSSGTCNLTMSGTTFMDQNRNLTVGTISSGAITSSGQITSGGTIQADLLKGNTSANNNYINFNDDTTTFGDSSNTTTVASIADVAIATNTNDGGGGDFIVTTGSSGTKKFEVSAAGAVTHNNAYTFPTADGSANQVLQTDGSGQLSFGTVTSGSTNASTLDSLDSTQFLRSDADDTATGQLTFSGNIISPTGLFGATGNSAPDRRIWAVSTNYNDWGIFYNEGSPDYIEFKSSGNVTAKISLDGGQIYSQGNNLVWHAGNDGSGSGLDADLLDGQQGSYYAQYNHFRSLGTTAFTAGGGSNNTLTTAQYISEMEGDGAFDSYSSVFKTSWSYAGNDNLSDAGSFGPTETAGMSHITWTDNSSDSTRGNITVLAIAPNTGGSAGGVYVYNDQGSSYAPGWREIWTSSTDGAGSGLDADLLDGQQGSYYAPASGANYVPQAGSWMGAGFSGSRYSGLSINSGEIAFLRDHPSNGKMSILVDGGYHAGENGGFYSIYSGNNYSNKSGFYADTSGRLQFSGQNYAQFTTQYGNIKLGPMNNSYAHIYTDTAGGFYFNKTALYADGNTMWHAGNDGSGSGLDADTVDGIQASSFLRSDANDTTTGNIVIGKALPKLILDSPGSGDAFTSQGAQISLGESGDGGSAALHLTYRGDGLAYIGMGVLSNGIPPYSQIRFNYNSNDIRFNSTPNVAGSTMWYAGNDGSGSGLDADLLDGQQGSYYTGAKGANNNYVASSTSTSNRGNFGGGVWAYTGYSTGSNRPFTYDATLQVMPASNLGFELSVDWVSQGTTPIKIRSLRDCCQGWSSYSTIWTSSTDGSGSGLDADLLDGQHGSYYSNYNNLSNKPTIPTNNNQLTNGAGYITASNSAITSKLPSSSYTASDVLTKIKTVDGSGSGLDADTVDGRQFHDNMGVSTRHDITVDGDSDKYYPVVISGLNHEAGTEVHIERGYSETAPSDWNTSTHKGGLSLRFHIMGASGWGGYPTNINVEEFGEIYSRILGGIKFTAHTMKAVVWLRGGTATYRIFTQKDTSIVIYDDTSSGYTSGTGWLVYDHSNNSYDVYENYRTQAQADTGAQNEVIARMPVRAGGTTKANQVNYHAGGSTLNGGNLFWNDANDGSGSGLDADTVDGIHGGSFLRSDTSDAVSNYSHKIQFYSNTNLASSSGSQASLECFSNGSGNDAFMAFHVGSDFACYLGLDGGTNKLSVGGWSMGGNSYEIYHAGNKPSLATLGFTGASNANYITNNNQLTNGAGYITASNGAITNKLPLAGGTMTGTITSRDLLLQSGYHLMRSNHHSGHLEGSYNNVGGNSTKSNPIYTIGSSYNPTDAALSDMYGIGYTHTNASFINFTGASGWGMYVAADGDARIYLDGSNGVVSSTGQHYVGSNVVWNAGNDGAGSGLDADRLDGQDGGDYLRSNATDDYNDHSNSSYLRFNTRTGELISDGGNNANFPLQIYAPASTDAAITFHVANDYAFYFGLDHATNDLSYGGWSIGSTKNKVWTARNDGAGSGLDADNLDGYTWGSSGKAITATGYTVQSGDGRGIGFWGGSGNPAGSSSYAIFMGTSGTYGRVDGETTSDYNMYFKMSAGTNRGFVFRNSSNNVAGIDSTGNFRAEADVVAFSGSDIRLKDNLTVISNPLEKLSKLSGYSFEWNGKQSAYAEGKKDIGLVAQEVEEVLPEIVKTRQDGFKGLQYEKLIPLLVEGMKEQQETINKLTDRINDLEKKEK